MFQNYSKIVLIISWWPFKKSWLDIGFLPSNCNISITNIFFPAWTANSLSLVKKVKPGFIWISPTIYCYQLKKENGKIVCQWKVSKRWENKKGEKFVEYEPNHSQKDIFINIDKKPASIYNYKINLKTKELLPIPEPENPKMQSSDK